MRMETSRKFLKVGASSLKFKGTEFHRELVGAMWPQSLSLVPHARLCCRRSAHCETDTRTPSVGGVRGLPAEPTSLEQSQDGKACLILKPPPRSKGTTKYCPSLSSVSRLALL